MAGAWRADLGRRLAQVAGGMCRMIRRSGFFERGARVGVNRFGAGALSGAVVGRGLSGDNAGAAACKGLQAAGVKRRSASAAARSSSGGGGLWSAMRSANVPAALAAAILSITRQPRT